MRKLGSNKALADLLAKNQQAAVDARAKKEADRQILKTLRYREMYGGAEFNAAPGVLSAPELRAALDRMTERIIRQFDVSSFVARPIVMDSVYGRSPPAISPTGRNGPSAFADRVININLPSAPLSLEELRVSMERNRNAEGAPWDAQFRYAANPPADSPPVSDDRAQVPLVIQSTTRGTQSPAGYTWPLMGGLREELKTSINYAIDSIRRMPGRHGRGDGTVTRQLVNQLNLQALGSITVRFRAGAPEVITVTLRRGI